MSGEQFLRSTVMLYEVTEGDPPILRFLSCLFPTLYVWGMTAAFFIGAVAVWEPLATPVLFAAGLFTGTYFVILSRMMNDVPSRKRETM